MQVRGMANISRGTGAPPQSSHRSSWSNGGNTSQSAFSTPSGLHRTVSEANDDHEADATSPLKNHLARSDVSGRHFFETLLGSPMFKKANIDSSAKEDHGMKQWLLHNIVFYFIVKAGKADLSSLYAGKQDGIVINNLFKPTDSSNQQIIQVG
jgi:hypothetical protein